MGSQIDFLFCQFHIPCSLISGIALLSFSCIGKTVKWGGISGPVGWQKSPTLLACVAHPSQIKEQFVDEAKVWKEASVAICKNLLVLEQLEVPGADEASVLVLPEESNRPETWCLWQCWQRIQAKAPVPSQLSHSHVQPLSIFSSILYILIEDFLTCQALCLMQRIKKVNTMYSFSSSPVW